MVEYDEYEGDENEEYGDYATSERKRCAPEDPDKRPWWMCEHFHEGHGVLRPQCTENEEFALSSVFYTIGSKLDRKGKCVECSVKGRESELLGYYRTAVDTIQREIRFLEKYYQEKANGSTPPR